MIYNQDIDFIQKQQYEILIVGGGAVGLQNYAVSGNNTSRSNITAMEIAG